MSILSRIFESNSDDRLIEIGAANPLVDCAHTILLPRDYAGCEGNGAATTLHLICEACGLEFIAGDEPVAQSRRQLSAG